MPASMSFVYWLVLPKGKKIKPKLVTY